MSHDIRVAQSYLLSDRVQVFELEPGCATLQNLRCPRCGGQVAEETTPPFKLHCKRCRAKVRQERPASERAASC